MAIRRKSGVIVVGFAASLFLALIFVVPSLLQVDRYRARVISYLQENTGKEVEIGQLTLTLFPVSLHIDNFGVKNPAIFPPGYVVQVARIDAAFSARALLRRQVVIKSLVLEDPVLNLTSDPDGPWNFENPQAKASQNAFRLGVISRVQIERGQLIASNLLPSDAAGPIFFEAHEISADLEQVNLMRNYRSSFFLDGRPGQPEGRSSAPGLSRGEKSEVETAVGSEARFFQGCQSGQSTAGVPRVTSPLICRARTPASAPMRD